MQVKMEQQLADSFKANGDMKTALALVQKENAELKGALGGLSALVDDASKCRQSLIDGIAANLYVHSFLGRLALLPYETPRPPAVTDPLCGRAAQPQTS